jgi:hypothetical protein
MAESSATPLVGDEDEQDLHGVYVVTNIGWFARSRDWSRGPFRSRELAEQELTLMGDYDPGLAENWIALTNIVASGLLLTVVVATVVLLLTGIVLIVHPKTGLH